MRRRPALPSSAPGSGFSLVEVLLAIAIAAFCLLPLLGLLPIGLKTHQTANEQTHLAAMAAMVVQDLENTPFSSKKSPRFQVTFPASSTGATGAPQSLYFDASGSVVGTVGATPSPSAFYRVSLGFTPPSQGHREATLVRVMVTWPALADKVPQTWPSRYTGIFQTVVALDRN